MKHVVRSAELVIEENVSADLKFHTVRVHFAGDPDVVGVGVAALSPGDKYNAHKGYRLALRRAFNDLMIEARPKHRRSAV